METIGFGLLRNERKPMLDLVLGMLKALDLGCFLNERKPMLDLFLKIRKPLESKLAFALDESQCRN